MSNLGKILVFQLIKLTMSTASTGSGAQSTPLNNGMGRTASLTNNMQKNCLTTDEERIEDYILQL